jgi:hypothetical protein
MGASLLGALFSVVSVLIALARRALKFGCLLLLAWSPALLSILPGDFSYPFNAETLHSGCIATFPKPRHHFGADVVAAMRSLENAPNMHLESLKSSQRM